MKSNQATTKLWEEVYKTDPEATKQANVNGQRITSINGMYMTKRATEMFGPIGIGWGVETLKESYIDGGAILSDQGESLGNSISHSVHVKLWYVWEGKRGEVEAYGCTPYVYRTKNGPLTDMEAPKKSFTDATKKALSAIGFSADIYMGMFDDLDYYQERLSESRVERAEDKEEEIKRQKEERLDWLKNAVNTMETALSLHELKTLHSSYVRSATRRNETAFVKRLARAFEKREFELKEKEEK